MNPVIEALAWLAAIWFILKLVNLYMMIKNQMLEEQLAKLAEQLKNKTIQVNIEKHGDMFYLFDRDTDVFIAQGTDLNQIEVQCALNFKGRSIVATEEQVEQLGLK
jgi:hypothetical protein